MHISAPFLFLLLHGASASPLIARREPPVASQDLTSADSPFPIHSSCNTTLSRQGVEGLPHGDEAGGLSGAPVREKSTHTVKILAGELAGRLPIIAAGGITEGRHAAEKIAAGASLVQIYSGFIYKGPALIRQSVDAIAAMPKRQP